MNFELIGAKWGNTTLGTPSGTVTWAADLGDDLNFNSARFDQSDFDAAIEAAFEAWENVASVDFVRAGSLATADVSVDMGALTGSVVGQASISVAALPGTDRITDVDILLDSGELWAPFGSGGTDFFAVAAHEIGHAIGLDHVDDPAQLMNPVVSADDLGDGDIAGAQVLYGSDPGDVSAPSSSAPAPAPAGDDGGGGGGGVGLIIGGLVALLASLFGGAAAAPLVLAALGGDDDDEPLDETETADHNVDHEAEELIAFLDEAFEAGQSYQIVHSAGPQGCNCGCGGEHGHIEHHEHEHEYILL